MNQVNPEDIETAEGDENVSIVFEPANNVGYLGFNQAKAPWGNIDCRLAVAHAIDKQAIVDTLYAGDAEPASNMMPPNAGRCNSQPTFIPHLCTHTIIDTALNQLFTQLDGTHQFLIPLCNHYHTTVVPASPGGYQD